MGRPVHRRVTSTDIANRVGVSRATVSYVLNDVPHKSISSEVRAAVTRAAEDLGYTPFGPARSLARGRSDIVLLVMPNWPFSQRIVELVDRLETALAEHGLALVVHRQVRPDEKVAQVWHSIRPAGVIGLEAFTDSEAATMRRAGIAVSRVVFEQPRAGAGAGILHVPQAEFGEAQVRHVAASGHRQIGYAYPSDPRVRVYADLRLSGARRACKALGLRAPKVRRIPATVDGATSAVEAWQAMDPPVTAIAAYNDQWAMALLAALHTRNVRVPNDVAVIGVDNDSVGVLTTPTLSTVAHDWRLAADYLSDTVIRALAGEPPSADHIDMPLRIFARQSAPWPGTASTMDSA